MPLRYQIEWTLPPSANKIWRNNRGRTHKSNEYVAWLKHCGGILMASGLNKGLKTISSAYKLHILLPANCRLDGDNTFKPINDALQRLKIVANDKKCRDGQFQFGEHENHCVVTVEEIPTPSQVA